jgi:uncharacterized protein YjiS (DUF1127 family)
LQRSIVQRSTSSHIRNMRNNRQEPGKGRKVFISFIRYVQAWRQYGEAVRELSSLNDRELADLGITRSDIPHVAWHSMRR